MWVGAERRAMRALREGLKRWPASVPLHERLGKRVFEKRGAKGLEALYAKLLEDETHARTHRWFAGRASVRAADQYRRSRNYAKAMAAYGRAVSHYEQVAADFPQLQEGIDHAVGMVLAARARVAYQRHDVEGSLQDILASLKRAPASAGTRDDMGITPGETAQMLLARLNKEARAEDAQALIQALDAIDPQLLRPDRP